MTKKYRLRQLIIDPSSDQYSASRLCLCILVGLVVTLAGLEAMGIKFTSWTALAAIVGSVAGAYGVNSAARVWKDGKGPLAPPKKDGE